MLRYLKTLVVGLVLISIGVSLLACDDNISSPPTKAQSVTLSEAITRAGYKLLLPKQGSQVTLLDVKMKPQSPVVTLEYKIMNEHFTIDQVANGSIWSTQQGSNVVTQKKNVTVRSTQGELRTYINGNDVLRVLSWREPDRVYVSIKGNISEQDILNIAASLE